MNLHDNIQISMLAPSLFKAYRLYFSLQILLEGRPEPGSNNSVAIYEIHIHPGYCLGQSPALPSSVTAHVSFAMTAVFAALLPRV